MSSGIFSKTWPYAAIIGAHLIWGISFVITKLTLQEFPPMSLAFLRFFLAVLLLLPFLFVERKQIKIAKNDLPWLIGVGALMVTLNIALFYNGLERTTVTSAAVLTMTVPLFSILVGWGILKEKVYVVNLVGIATGLVGAILIIGIPTVIFGKTLSPQMLLGDLLIVLASIVWVAGVTISRLKLKEYSTLTITAAIFLVGAVTFLIPAIHEYQQNPTWISHVTPLGIFGLIFITIAASISAYFLFEWGLSRVGVTQADLFQYIEPPIATAMAVLVLNEPLQFSFIIGGILIAVGVYWSTLLKPEHKHHQAHRT